MLEYIRENYIELCREIDEAVKKRGGGEVKLVSVTKSGTDEELLSLIEAGAPDIGENRPQELVRRGVLKNTAPPKGIPEMTRLIEGSFDANPGTIYTVDTDCIDEAALADILASHAGSHIGAMGTRSKKFLHNAGISPEFTYGVVDKSLLSAMIGEDTIIFTCGGMVERVDLRVSLFEEASGTAVRVVKLYSSRDNQ